MQRIGLFLPPTAAPPPPSWCMPTSTRTRAQPTATSSRGWTSSRRRVGGAQQGGVDTACLCQSGQNPSSGLVQKHCVFHVDLLRVQSLGVAHCWWATVSSGAHQGDEPVAVERQTCSFASGCWERPTQPATCAISRLSDDTGCLAELSWTVGSHPRRVLERRPASQD